MPIYDSLGENAVEYIVNHAGVELIYVDIAKLSAYVKVRREMRPETPQAQHMRPCSVCRMVHSSYDSERRSTSPCTLDHIACDGAHHVSSFRSGSCGA